MSLLFQTLKKRLTQEAGHYPGGDEYLPLRDLVTKEGKRKEFLRNWGLAGGTIIIFLSTFLLIGNIRESKESVQKEDLQVNRVVPIANDHFSPGGLIDSPGKGFFCYVDKNWDQAIREYEKSIILKPGSPKLLNDLGVIYYHRGKIDMAIRKIEEAIRLESKFPEAHFNLAIILEEKGSRAKSKEHYQKFVYLAKDSYPALAREIKLYLHYW